MSKLICHAGHRVVVVRAVDKTAVVRHRKDGSKCLSKLLFQGKNKYTPDEVLVRGDHSDNLVAHYLKYKPVSEMSPEEHEAFLHEGCLHPYCLWFPEDWAHLDSLAEESS